MQRTLIAETVNKVGETVTIKGWVNTRRDHGKIVFIDLRDRTGVVQVVCTEAAKDLRSEFVISITGLVKARPEKLINKNLPTGTIEIEVQEVVIDAFRQALKARDFMEFQAPCITPAVAEGGAEVFRVQYFEHEAYLSQSPQLYKSLLVGDFERV